MDALAQLALMTKAKLVFERPDTFLSFPVLSPLSYAPEQLTFLPTAHSMSVLSEFSELTNALPQGVLFEPSLDHTLGTVYLDLLRNAELAKGSLPEEQNAQLQAAQALLQTQGPAGLPAPSAQALAYDHYQQAYFRATQNYKAQQVTSVASSDPAVQAQWQNVDEPALRAQIDAAESDWEKSGFKAEIEQAKQTVQECVAQSPALQWKNWVSECNPDIDFLTDSNNQTFAPTVFSPFDVLSQDNWTSFTMNTAEIQQLASQAPPELIHAIGTAAPDTMIYSLSFEFCSVMLVRPWFHSEVFAAQFWKFADPSRQLSDGGNPPQGEWPAYTTALIFARNIVVTKHTVAGTVQKQALTAFPRFVAPRVVMAPPVVVAPPHPAGAPALHSAVVVTRASHPAPRVAPKINPKINPKIAPKNTPKVNPKTAQNTAPRQVARPPAKLPARPVRVAPPVIHPAVLMRLNAAAFTMHPAPISLPQPAPSVGSVAAPAPAKSALPSSSPGTAVPTPTTQSSPAPGKVSILAFICKRLPKCPNPDKDLSWE